MGTSESGFEVDRLTRVETKLDEVLRRLDSDLGPQRIDHESRLRRLEEKVTELGTEFRVRLAVGGTVVLGGGAGLGAVIAHVTGA